MITKKKLSYEGPVCEVFEVQMEAVMLNDSNRLQWDDAKRPNYGDEQDI